MKVKPTKEMILTAVKKGKVTYHTTGRSNSTESILLPSKAKEALLKLADKIENGQQQEVDLSIAFDRDPTAIKVTIHKGKRRKIAYQNQR